MIKQIIFISFLCCMLPFPTYTQEFKKLRLIVFDLKAGNGIKQSEAEIITELIRNELINSDRFDVVGRDNIDRVLKEIRLQQECGVECEINVGRYLIADKNITGIVSKFGDSYIVNVKMTDIKKGTYDFGESETFNRLEDSKTAANNLANKLIDDTFSENNSPVTPKKEETIENPTKKEEVIVIPDEKPKKEPVVVNDPPVKHPPKTSTYSYSNKSGYNFLYSVFIPGWGQLENEQEVKASIIFLSFLTVSTSYLVANISYSYTGEKYNTAANKMVASTYSDLYLVAKEYSSVQKLHSKYENSGKVAESLYNAMVGIYLYSIIDAMLFGSIGSYSGYNPKDGFFFSTSTSKNRDSDKFFFMSYTWSF